MITNDEIVREEIEAILKDIITAYELSGKKVSGEFENGLGASFSSSNFKYTGTVKGYVYLTGRGPGKMPPIKRIEEWVKKKGVFTVKTKAKIRSLAFAIANKIAKEGTNQENAMRIYEQVITPERINKIIDRVSELNVNKIITEVRAELEILAKNV